VSIYSNTETSVTMSTLAIWCRVVQSRDVSPHNFDGVVMSGLAFSLAPFQSLLVHSAVVAVHLDRFCYLLTYLRVFDGLDLLRVC